jgi:hypothetical protein
MSLSLVRQKEQDNTGYLISPDLVWNTLRNATRRSISSLAHIIAQCPFYPISTYYALTDERAVFVSIGRAREE